MEERKTPTVLIIILIVIILLLGGYIALDKVVLSKRVTDNKVSVEDVSIDLNTLYQVGDTLNKFDTAFNDSNSNYFGYLYKSDKLQASKFDNGAALFTTIYSDLVGTNTAQYLIGGNVKNNFEKIFGKNLAYKPQSINAGNYYKIVYNESNSTFTYTAPTVTNVYPSEYVVINTKTQVEEDEILVTRRVFFVDYQSNNGGTDITKASIYTNSDKKKLVGEVNLRNNVLNEEEVLGKYGSSLNEYQFTFKQNDNNDNYSFYQVEKVK